MVHNITVVGSGNIVMNVFVCCGIFEENWELFDSYLSAYEAKFCFAIF